MTYRDLLELIVQAVRDAGARRGDLDAQVLHLDDELSAIVIEVQEDVEARGNGG